MKTAHNRIKIGIIGCGAVAYRWYLKGLAQSTSEYKLFVVCDKDISRAKKAASDFDVSHFCEDFRDLVKLGIDLAVILTRHEDHPQMISYFLKHDVHVYSEKPFAPTYSVGKKLCQLAKERNLIFGSAPQIMFSTRNQKAKELIAEGKIGEVAYVRSSCSNLGPAGRADTDYDPVWFYNQGGSLSSLGIYGLSTLIFIMGKPSRVSSFQGIGMPKREVLFGPAAGKKFAVTAPDSVVALFEFDPGVFAVFDGSYVMTTPPGYEMEFHGTKGSLMVGGFGGPESIHYYPLGSKVYEKIGPDDDCHLTWNISWAVVDTALAILEKRAPKASADFALSVIDVMDAMHASNRSGKNTIMKKRLE